MELWEKIFIAVTVGIILAPFVVFAVAMTLDALYLHFDDGGE